MKTSRLHTPFISLRIVLLAIVAVLLFASFYGPYTFQRLMYVYHRLMSPGITGEGDSLMENNYALSMLREKLETESGTTWLSTNIGKGGERVGVEILASESADGLPYLYPWKTNDKIWLFAGTNDLAAPNGVDKLLRDVEMYFKNAKAAGYSEDMCFYTDVLPSSRRENPAFEEDRQSFNSKIASRLAGLAHVIPSGSNPLLQDPSNREYFSDGVHLTKLGYFEIANDASREIKPYLR